MRTLQSQFPLTSETAQLKGAFNTANQDIRLAGGAVRDILLGIEPKDFDFCTTATPDQIMAIGEAQGFTVVPTGLQHGTVTLVINHVPFEITTLRIDSDQDGRHATVEFTTDFEKDMARRDLTINALSMDFNGVVYDYFTGLQDLFAQPINVQFVGRAHERCQEDYLRILRYFRFAARYGSKIPPSMVMMFGVQSMLDGLAKISKERVWLEMQKLIMYRNAPYVLRRMCDAGIFEVIGMHAAGIADDMVDYDCPEAAFARMYVASYDKTKDARQICEDWKMSAAERDKIVWLVANYFEFGNRHGQEWEDWLVNGVQRDWVVSLARMRNALQREVDHIANWEIPVCPVKGQDLLDAGMAPGKEVGQRLAWMRNEWIKSRFRATKEQLMAA